MPHPSDRFRCNDADCTAKVMDGEAIIINLGSGVYYSLDKAGGMIWELVTDGHSIATVADALAARYEISPEQARDDVDRLISQLLTEALILPIEAEGSPVPPAPANHGTPLPPYDSPQLQIYRDMGDLLALDPPVPALDDLAWKK